MISVPMLPAAPARLSTTTCCPICWLMSVASKRAVTSGPLPAAKGTINRIGRSGYSAAAALVLRIAAASANFKIVCQWIAFIRRQNRDGGVRFIVLRILEHGRITLEHPLVSAGASALAIGSRQLGLNHVNIAFVIGRDLVTWRMILLAFTDIERAQDLERLAIQDVDDRRSSDIQKLLVGRER